MYPEIAFMTRNEYSSDNFANYATLIGKAIHRWEGKAPWFLEIWSCVSLLCVRKTWTSLNECRHLLATIRCCNDHIVIELAANASILISLVLPKDS